MLAGHGSGKPSTKGMNAYCASRYAQDRGLVEVRRFPNLTNDQRQQLHDTYSTIIGRNQYNQSLRSYCHIPYEGNYYSDCSSSICRTAEKIGIPDVASLNTAGMHYYMEKVDDILIQDGMIINPEVLNVGDALMFKGADPKRPLQIGHTEMVYQVTYKQEHSDGICELGNTDTSNYIIAGKDCIKLGQKALNNFINAGLKIDGIIGRFTKTAINTAMQTALNLDYGYDLMVDGILGKETISAIDNSLIKYGDVGYIVTVVEILLLLNQYNPNGIEYPGIYGEGCKHAIGLFQDKHNLRVDYIVGKQTFESLIKL